ncbi:MAG TPA: M56 family metallopeptidase [Thermoanaerobaculia bacterium]|nr:M56 family metallopeptidase [Thermoanaerobaculia bacterium]
MAALWQSVGYASGWLWTVAAQHLWEATVFTALVFLLMALLRRLPARTRYSLGLLAAVKFLAPSVLLFSLLKALRPDAFGLASMRRLAFLDPFAVLAPGAPPARAADLVGIHGFGIVFAAAWIAGGGILAALWWQRRRNFVEILGRVRRAIAAGGSAQDESQAAGRSALQIGHTAERAALADIRRRLGIRRPVELVISAEVLQPGVWGIWRPVVVLPEGILAELTPGELEMVLLHELLHVRRWDNLTSHLQMVLCWVFWFHPLVWLLDRRLLAERELACDEQVLRLSGASNLYARCLLKVLRHGIGWRLAGASVAGGANLRRRLGRILAETGDDRAQAPWRPRVHRGVVAATALLLVASSLAAGGAAFERALFASCRQAAHVVARHATSPSSVSAVHDAHPRALQPTASRRPAPAPAKPCHPSGPLEFGANRDQDSARQKTKLRVA